MESYSAIYILAANVLNWFSTPKIEIDRPDTYADRRRKLVKHAVTDGKRPGHASGG